MGLVDTIKLALNCFDEGLETKEESIKKIVYYVDENYVSKNKLHEAFKEMNVDVNEKP